MTEEYIYEREQELLDYFRNNQVDPEDRSKTSTETFTASESQTTFWLTNVFVKNVRDTITVGGVTKYKGSDYTVTYGEGKNKTKVVLSTGASLGDAVVIIYDFGKSMIEREFSRTDVLLPRIVMMFLTGSEEFVGLGDAMEDATGSYFNASYRFEIRDKYANRARVIASQLFNWARKLRRQNLFRVNIARAYDLENFDYDREKEAYVWQFSLDIQWDLLMS